MRYSTALSGIAALTFGIAISLPAQAVTKARSVLSQGGTACQLSVPTTDTKVRPKASGFRNEGTASAFVICGYPTPDGKLTQFTMRFQSLDGAAHVVDCTGVNGPPNSAVYSAKSVTPDEEGNGGLIWTAADFGGTAGENMPNNGYMSATCTLPGEVSITKVTVDYDEDVGS